MCGIVGYAGREQAAPILLDGLSRLEYRGYDSAGVAVYHQGRIQVAKGKGGGKFRMVQNGGLAAGGKKIFFKLLRLGKLDKLFIHQVVKGNFPFPPPAQLQNYIYGGVTNDNLAKGVKGVLDMHFVGFIFGHGNSPSLIIVRGGSTPCCRPLIACQQRRAGLSTAARYAPFILTVDWLGWLC